MYLIDTNVLIEAKNRYYAFDIAPGFWAWLDYAYDHSLAGSITAVRDELLTGDDELTEWAEAHPAFFRDIDQATTRHFPGLTAWATSGIFTSSAQADFADNRADYLLVAYALEHSDTVVTHEAANLQKRNRVLIPVACQAMGVKSVNTFEMLRETGAQLDLREAT